MAFSENDKLLRGYIHRLCFILSVIAMILIEFGLQLLYQNIYGNISYEFWAGFVKAVITGSAVIVEYGVYALLVCGLMRYGYKRSRTLMLLCFAGTLTANISHLAVVLICSARSFTETLGNNILFIALNTLIGLLSITGIIILVSLLRRHYILVGKTNIKFKKVFDTNNPLFVVCDWVLLLVTARKLASVIVDRAGSAVPYIELVCVAAIGFVIMRFFVWLVEKAAIHFKSAK